MWLDENVDDFKQPPNYPCLCLLQEFAHGIYDLEMAERARRRMEFFKEDAAQHGE